MREILFWTSCLQPWHDARFQSGKKPALPYILVPVEVGSGIPWAGTCRRRSSDTGWGRTFYRIWNTWGGRNMVAPEISRNQKMCKITYSIETETKIKNINYFSLQRNFAIQYIFSLRRKVSLWSENSKMLSLCSPHLPSVFLFKLLSFISIINSFY